MESRRASDEHISSLFSECPNLLYFYKKKFPLRRSSNKEMTTVVRCWFGRNAAVYGQVKVGRVEAFCFVLVIRSAHWPHKYMGHSYTRAFTRISVGRGRHSSF